MKFESLDLRGAVPQVVGPPREVNKLELARVVEHHRRWVESKGLHGRRADLTRAELEGTCLSGTSINLQDAVLHGVNLRRADLSMSDLRQACLAGADLREANLLGAKLRGADLQGATLEGAAHLWAEQLAGTNLAAATLDPTFRFEALATVAEVSRRARRLWLFLLLACLATVWVVLSSTDAQLLVGSVSPLPLLGRFFPLVEFHLLTPLLLLGLYIYLQLSVQRMWEGLGTLPAIFPDGDPVDAKAHPWLLTGLARTYSPWLQEKGAAPSALEQQVTLLLGYWVVPATLLLCWGRYLTRQDLHGSLQHVGLLAAAVAFALNLPALAERTLRLENRPPPRSERILRHARGTWRGVTVLSLAVLLAILSFGITYGAPHDTGRAPDIDAADVRRWPAYALWAVGYSPFAVLTEMDVSGKPDDWTGSEEDLARVEGARLNKASLRYAEAYRAFLVNAHLWQADLRGAYLSEADLRGANLRQANLRGAVLDRAQLVEANLQRGALQNANLARADLRSADLSYASLGEAILIDATLSGANCYSADLNGARLVRANLHEADLREADLNQADLGLADLSGAYLWSAKLSQARLHAASLRHAFLMSADLRGADLQGADLQEAILQGALLHGADLAGADLRLARGLTAQQLCSTRNLAGVQLDPALAQAVRLQCGD
jgi:uncharacterized protein YjbI with pentapeptide repeats